MSVQFNAVNVLAALFISARKLYGETFKKLKIITGKQRFSELVSLMLHFLLLFTTTEGRFVNTSGTPETVI